MHSVWLTHWNILQIIDVCASEQLWTKKKFYSRSSRTNLKKLKELWANFGFFKQAIKHCGHILMMKKMHKDEAKISTVKNGTKQMQTELPPDLLWTC